MTCFLVSQLGAGRGAISLGDAFALSREVQAYVEETFPGTTQTPVLVDNLASPFLLRPGD